MLIRHSDPKLTERVYTIVDVETLRREVSRMALSSAHVPTVGQTLAHREPQAPSLARRETSMTSDSGGLRASDPGAIRTRDLRFRNASSVVEQGVSPSHSTLTESQGGVSKSSPEPPQRSRVVQLWSTAGG